MDLDRRSVHRGGLRWFTRLPKPFRRVLVRVIKPCYTVSAMVVIRREDGHVLRVRHSYNVGAGLPGGLVDRREPIEDAAHREVREEVGIGVDLTGPPMAMVDPLEQIVRVVFAAKPADGDDGASAHPVSAEIAAVSWAAASDRAGLTPEANAALDLVTGVPGR